MLKATKMHATKKAKTIKVREWAHPDYLHCGFADKTPMSVTHFLALIMYTDHSELCTLLSASLRRQSPGEQMLLVKRRNASYYHLSKTLRESVAMFGKSRAVDHLRGPFFCGMNRALAVPAFAIRLFAPTSTSTSLEVATRFANDGGCVFGLNNTITGGGFFAHFFDVSWLSRYKEEQERLWMGGEYLIQIASVRVLSSGSWENYCEHFAALFWFDAVCNASHLSDADNGSKRMCMGGKNISFLSAVLSEDDAKRPDLPEYVRDCIQLYRLSKTLVRFDMSWFRNDKCPSGTNSLFFDDLVDGKVWEEDLDNTVYSEIDGHANMIKESVLRFFPNMQQLTIETTDRNGLKVFQSSLRRWFAIFSSLATNKCTLNAVRPGWTNNNDERSWLYYVYPSVADLFASKSVKVELQSGHRRDSLVFTRV